jgi:uncharacterized membrane protein required for colicin V production
MNVLDYTILLILLLGAVIGYRKGLTDTLAGVVSVVIAMLLAVFYCDNSARFLEENFNIISSLSVILRNKFPLVTPAVNNLLADRFWNADTAVGQPVPDLAYWLVVSGCFLILLWLGSKILKLLLKSLSGVFSWGVLGWFNRLGGMALALVKNGLIIGILAVILQPLVGVAARAGVSPAQTFWTLLGNSVICFHLVDVFNFIRAVCLKGA